MPRQANSPEYAIKMIGEALSLVKLTGRNRVMGKVEHRTAVRIPSRKQGIISAAR